MCKNNFYNWILKLLFLIFFETFFYHSLAVLCVSLSLFFWYKKIGSLLIEILNLQL